MMMLIKKYYSLTLGVVLSLIGTLIFLRRVDVIREMFKGNPDADLMRMVKPILLCLIGIFFIYIFFKRDKENGT